MPKYQLTHSCCIYQVIAGFDEAAVSPILFSKTPREELKTHRGALSYATLFSITRKILLWLHQCNSVVISRDPGRVDTREHYGRQPGKLKHFCTLDPLLVHHKRGCCTLSTEKRLVVFGQDMIGRLIRRILRPFYFRSTFDFTSTRDLHFRWFPICTSQGRHCSTAHPAMSSSIVSAETNKLSPEETTVASASPARKDTLE